ncbi:YbhB/YbcL family Raf kinase inhibitor-like protein [Herbiconiux moechotypicola]|uniref:YbhB/YbcL family Raf kinase inhibitor-like protein n=1 Tax=Herbiconiux moechotypicola TaxID=637393 RepID=A0ABN3DEG8_9MICO|nr:YbhB/YbcL family Raf kinase inhibitor-like protein [Herbiconiux moechotypicola]MCS5729268.1 YbhB/YbcL family Raf kinase inhibitor-like protein [Herbiconiux moechotypicola]
MTTPFDRLPAVPALTVTSTDVADGGDFATPQYSAIFGVPGGEDRSPQVAWTGVPDGAKSFVVSLYDPEAPTPSGFWHWMVVDLPAETAKLETGIADLPAGAWVVKNDARVAAFIGSAPPAGAVDHYALSVQALDVAGVGELGIDSESTPAFVSFAILPHVIARGVITAVGRG